MSAVKNVAGFGATGEQQIESGKICHKFSPELRVDRGGRADVINVDAIFKKKPFVQVVSGRAWRQKIS